MYQAAAGEQEKRRAGDALQGKKKKAIVAWNYPDNWDGAASTSNYRYGVTRTYYDASAFSGAQARFTNGTQNNLRKRVA